MKKTLAFFVATIMMICSFGALFTNVSYASNDIIENNVMDGDPAQQPGNSGENQEKSFMIDFGTAEWVVNGVTVTAATQWVPVLNNGPVEIGEGDLIRVNNFDSSTMQIVVQASDGFRTILSLVSSDETTLMSRDAENLPGEGTLTFLVEAKPQDNNGPINPPPEENQGEVHGGEEAIEFDIKTEGTNINLWINNLEVLSDTDGVIRSEFKGTIQNAGTTKSDETNIISVCPLFGEKDVKEYIINDVSYKLEDAIGLGEGRTDFEVPGAAKYTVRVVVDEDSEVIHTIIWANPNYVNDGIWTEEAMAEMLLVNGNGYIKEVYDTEGNLVDSSEYISPSDAELGVGENGFGYATPKPGYKVVFQFVPDYGYQLTDIKANGQSIGIGEKLNEFVFDMPDTNVHFTAEFTKTEDVIKTESEKVTGGEIVLAKDTIDAGTAQLTVKDIELNAEKVKGFEAAAEGYTIQNFLDIDLYQVFYKGKEDSEDVWSNKIDELTDEAEITLKLKDGLRLEDVVIVHNIHDGDEYEIIEISKYDEETNTITFKTKSFSGYAIALKPVAEEKEIVLVDEKTKASIEFVDSEGHTVEKFDFTVMDISNLSEEEITELGIPKTEYEKGLKIIKENCEKEGTFLKLLNIVVNLPGEDRDVTKGPFKIKLPYTDELKGYENFKLAYVDSEDFSIKDIVELKLEGDYLVGILEHLSPYVLIGKVAEAAEETTANTIETAVATTNNPTTGDNIVIFGSIFVLSTLAMAFEIFVIKKSKLYR